MPEYVTKLFECIQHLKPKWPQYAPHQWTVTAYSKQLLIAPAPDKSDLLYKKKIKWIKSMVGTFLYYAWSVDPTMLGAINEISIVQKKPTKDTDKKSSILLNYAATYPNVVIQYRVSNMVLRVDSNAAYLTMPETRSWYAGNCISVISLHWSSLKCPQNETVLSTHNAKQFPMWYQQQHNLKRVEHSIIGKKLSLCDHI